MQENEFEKQVRQKMDAFQLRPAEAVWQQVKLQVTQKKESKKRYLIFTFLLLAFLAGSLGVADLEQYPLNKQAKKGIEKNSPATTQNSLQQHQSTMMAGKFNDNKTVQGSFTETDGKTNNSRIRKTTKGTIKATITEAGISYGSTAADENIPVQKQPLPAVIDVVKEEKQAPENTAPKDITTKEQLKNDSKKESAAIAKPVQPSTQKTKSKLLNTAFLFAIGRSLPLDNDPAKNETAADYTGGIGSGGTTNSAGGGGLGTYYYPSAAEPGLSLVVGFEMSRFISAKTSVGLGLQYQLFTTSIATGEKLNNGNGNVFLYGNSNHYTSFYHFITLPISLSTQIAAVKGRGILLNTGINFSRLIGTNALSFDNTQGKYYEDNTALDKTQVGLSASVLINLAGKNKAPLYIGPDLYYGITAQASSGMYAASHYRSFGITIKKMLKWGPTQPSPMGRSRESV